MKHLIAITLITLFSSLGFGSKPKCVMGDREKQEMLMLDYKSFDQTLPDGGWRGVAQKGCDLLAANLIEEYQAKHSAALEKWQTRVLTWHSGQMYALLEMRPEAVKKFKLSYDDRELPDSILNWNMYVDASIAFLEKNKKALIKVKEKMVASKPEDPNLKNVKSFIRCFDRPYRDAYNPSCS